MGCEASSPRFGFVCLSLDVLARFSVSLCCRFGDIDDEICDAEPERCSEQPPRFP